MGSSVSQPTHATPRGRRCTIPGGLAPRAEPDLWPAWEALAGRPLLVIRGALSDLLGETTLKRMLERMPGAEGLTVENVGHTPTLDEPEAVAAIERLLARVA